MMWTSGVLISSPPLHGQQDGGADKDIRSHINKARHAFNTLRLIWNSIALSKKTKVCIFAINVKAVLFYGSET